MSIKSNNIHTCGNRIVIKSEIIYEMGDTSICEQDIIKEH